VGLGCQFRVGGWRHAGRPGPIVEAAFEARTGLVGGEAEARRGRGGDRSRPAGDRGLGGGAISRGGWRRFDGRRGRGSDHSSTIDSGDGRDEVGATRRGRARRAPGPDRNPSGETAKAPMAATRLMPAWGKCEPVYGLRAARRARDATADQAGLAADRRHPRLPHPELVSEGVSGQGCQGDRCHQDSRFPMQAYRPEQWIHILPDRLHSPIKAGCYLAAKCCAACAAVSAWL
jgi:hypothetical protein